MSANRRFTPDEDARLEQLRIEGGSLRGIARQLGRRHSAIWMRLNMLAERAEADDDGAWPEARA